MERHALPARRCQVLLDKCIFDSKNVTSQRLRGGVPHAPVMPLSTKVDTLFMKVGKQTDTKNIGKGLFYPQITVKPRYYGEEKPQPSAMLLHGG